MDAAAGAAPLPRATPSLDELLGRADLWRGNRLAAAPVDGVPTGFAELDAVLPGGGWPIGALVEILVDGTAMPRRPGQGVGTISGSGELSLLLPALARQTRAGGWVVLVAPPLQAHAPAWATAGVDLSRLIVAAAEVRDRLWVADRSLRCTAVDAVLAWLPQVDMSFLRRLQLSAESGRATLFAFRPAAAAAQSSPAPLRIALSGSADGAQLRILKRRGPPLATPLTVALARPVRPVPRSLQPAPAAGCERQRLTA